MTVENVPTFADAWFVPQVQQEGLKGEQVGRVWVPWWGFSRNKGCSRRAERAGWGRRGTFGHVPCRLPARIADAHPVPLGKGPWVVAVGWVEGQSWLMRVWLVFPGRSRTTRSPGPTWAPRSSGESSFPALGLL